jgi:hypothetical protein
MPPTGMSGTACISTCGLHRWTLTRTWDARPVLLVAMFNPSKANHEVNDPTITILCQIAAANGYGGIVVVNGIPLRTSAPGAAADFANNWDKRQDWSARDSLQMNLAAIVREVERAGAVLLAWGALADRSAHWFELVLEEIECALPDGVPLLCLGKTAAGHPKHPMARGRHKVPKDAPLQPWKATP